MAPLHRISAFWLGLCLLILTVSSQQNLKAEYQKLSFTNTLNKVYPNNQLGYEIQVFDQYFFTFDLETLVYNISGSTIYDPAAKIRALGCDRKIHVSADNRIFCVDDKKQVLHEISKPPEFQVINTYYIGFNNTQYYDWIDFDTQYIVMPQYFHRTNPETWNYTIFNMTNNQFVQPFYYNWTQIAGPNFVQEGYCISKDYICFGMQDNSHPVRIYKYTFATRELSLIANVTQIKSLRRIMDINYINIVFMLSNVLYTVNSETGSVNSYTLPSGINSYTPFSGYILGVGCLFCETANS